MSSSDSTPRRLPAGRKAELAAFVADAGEVTVAQLAERFEVSADTIRRDLDQLDADGVLVRTHGGAVGLSTAPRPNTELDVRMRMQTQAKERIGARAAALVRDGQAIIVNAGTTTLSLIRALGERRGICRYASLDLAMDETLTRAAIDVSGRPFLVWNVTFTSPKVGTFDTELVREFFQALAQNAGITLHVTNHYGANSHHIAETCFKAVARVLRTAIEADARQAGAIPSTKGTLKG